MPHHHSWLPLSSARLGASDVGFCARDVRSVTTLRLRALYIRHSVSYLPAISGKWSSRGVATVDGSPAPRCLWLYLSRGARCCLFRPIDRDGNLIDTILSATRNMSAARGSSARHGGCGFRAGPYDTDGHSSYPRAIRSTLGRNVHHGTSVYLNNRLEQDRRGIKGWIRCMCGFKEHDAADRVCREHDEQLPSQLVTSQPIRSSPPGGAVAFSVTLASQLASCEAHDHDNPRGFSPLRNGARHDRTQRAR